MSREGPCTLHQVFPDGNIFHKHRTVSPSENGHQYNPESVFRFHWLQMNSCLCVGVCVWVCACMSVYVCAKLLQSCLTLCDPMDCSLPGSSVHGILQARILKWVAVPFSRVCSSIQFDHTQVHVTSTTRRLTHAGSLKSHPLTPFFQSLATVDMFSISKLLSFNNVI